MIDFKDHQLHFHRLGDGHSLRDQGALGLDVIINGNLNGTEALGIAHILQIEHEVLAPADIRVHPQVVLLNDSTPVKLVPQNAIVEVGRVFHHVGGKILPAHQTVFLNIALGGDPLSHHTVEIRNNQVAGTVFHGPHQ